MSENKYVIGIDLGGTKIATALCDTRCNIQSKVRIDTGSADGQDRVLQRMKESVLRVCEQSGVPIGRVSAIGVCSPGPLNVSDGVILYVATLGWRNVPLRQLLQNEFCIPVYIENDCDAAAYGELLLGAGRGQRDIIYITMSTGIGSGIIMDRKIHHGRHDAAGEFGHICIEAGGRQCSCGNRGCLQAYASGTAISQLAAEHLAGNPQSSLWRYVASGNGRLSCPDVAMAAQDGDEAARTIWRAAGEKLGQGISILLQLFDPDTVILGGGVSKAWGLFHDTMTDAINKNVYELIRENMVIVPAQLGDDAGLFGAVLIALREQDADCSPLIF